VSLSLAIAVLALAVLAGGLAAFSGERGRKAMPALRAFAVVAAASIALIHLLPEAIAGAGFITLLATAAGAIVPALLERLFHPHEDHAPHAPSTALAMGYAAVVVHQAGEGAALAGLAKTGALTVGLVLAIAAHTVPLAMVVALRVLESYREGPGLHRAIGLALAGVAGATAAGAFAGSLVETSRLEAVQPWVLAAAAGLLLHALGHDAFERTSGGVSERIRDGVASGAGIAVAVLGLEPGAWSGGPSTWLRGFGVALLSAAVVAKVSARRASPS
jgi:hypothetical protein